MRYNNKYAMPVDPRALEQDFKTPRGTIADINHALKNLKGADTADDLNYLKLESLAKKVRRLWFKINLKEGINLKDRERLYPLFKEMNRVFDGNKTVPVAYRGVRMPRFSPRGVSENDPNVKEILEGLAYGLRSWTSDPIMANSWASGAADDTPEKAKGRDKVVFEIENPQVVLDCNKVLRYYIRTLRDFFQDEGYPFDWDENILKLDNPKVLSIRKKEGYDDLYIVKVKD